MVKKQKIVPVYPDSRLFLVRALRDMPLHRSPAFGLRLPCGELMTDRWYACGRLPWKPPLSGDRQAPPVAADNVAQSQSGFRSAFAVR